ncbi:MAG: bifunctional hydroxymethylpyrimidine kinase/phosphomethylpyrimidine kinase [Thaumarchaeota archaeon]|nr:bifunctional hydroxymethylpyrimidine kinase/phosphomethylpyrimidine kinase [Candidatus Calditenuaceae archaeon]MDW8042208.1 bifunctional hydroxymethylpyrimidine kinase/phosphomethylpyrimidine kinase [Nitrososphaerota archaeon]
MRIPRALTVAGSDSGGGAGIQADLKTFAALGVHGMSAITSITAQNTYQVTRVVDLDPDMVVEQIRVCVEDIGVDSIKTGMLHTSEIIRAVASELKKIGVPVVVDPVMVAKSGAPLLKPDAIESLKSELLPVAAVVTPNAREAERLCGFEVRSVEDQARAAKEIARMGCRTVVVKGGHVQGPKVVDVVYHEGEVVKLEGERLESKNTHGTGCAFASAIAAHLAHGREVVEAVRLAKEFVADAIRHGLDFGRGAGPINPSWSTLRKALLLESCENVRAAAEYLESVDGAGVLCPESMINLAEVVPFGERIEDVVGLPGRIVRVGNKLRVSSCPMPGGSKHLASAVLTAHSFDKRFRAAMNVRFDEGIVEAARHLGLSVSSYDRSKEPPSIKAIEGMTIRWGVSEAFKAAGRVTDIIYHKGDFGKEPMILILGSDAIDVVKKFHNIFNRYFSQKTKE